MKTLLLLSLIGIASNPLALAQSANQQNNPEQQFKWLLQEMADGRGALNEKATAQRRAIADRTLADSYIEVLENGDMRTKAEIVESRTPERNAETAKLALETKLTIAIEDVRVQTYGDMALVNYIINNRLVFNGEPVIKIFRCTETFIQRDGRWQSVRHTETAVPGEPVWAKVDTNSLKEYAGQYRLTPSTVWTVFLEGDKLFWGINKQELVPENENTFVFRRHPKRKVNLNNSYRVIFVRGEKGRVTHLRMREFPGVEYSAIKIK